MNPLMKYPVFVSEQVLTAKNLNDIVEYLNEQNLSTRRNLIGIGIACGLAVSSDQKTYVKISCGCGVTSLGLLINIPEQELNYYRKYTDLATVPYSKFLKSDNTQYNLWEILTKKEYEEADNPTSDHKIEGNTDFDLKDMVALLYLELIDKDLDNCIDEGCDEKGIMRLFNLRKLLIRKGDLLSILRKDSESGYLTMPSESDLFKKANPACTLPVVQPHRLDYNLSDLTSLNLSSINSWIKLKNSFLEVIKADVINIGSALYNSYKVYGDELLNLYSSGNPFTGFDNASVSSNQLYQLIESQVNENDINVQYAYDFICDLVKAYDEFLEIASVYRSKCCINTDSFPYHLMLGVVVKNSKKIDAIYRHHWQSSPAVSNMNDVLERLRFLHYKIYQLIVNFNLRSFPRLENIIITPGKFSGWPLSNHSIAHYYSNGTSGIINQYWNYNLYKTCKEDTVLSYFPGLYSSLPFVLHPLLYSLRDYEYFRIEGHIGQEYKSVRTKLQQLIKDFNLPFDVFGIKLSGDSLDIELEDNCFNDIQTAYKCNRDEYLGCVKTLSDLIDAFIKAIAIIVKKYPGLLDYQINEGNGLLGFIKTLRQLYLILQLYFYYLKKVQQQLPEHIKNFKFEDFRESYYIVYAFTFVIQIFLEFLSNLIHEFSAPFLQIMLLKTLFERILDDCMESKFKSLYDMYHERLMKLQLGRLFPGYVDGSPGMEHIAGVKEGGTFILVYDEFPDQVPEEPEEPEKPEEDPCPEDEESKQTRLTILQYAHILTREPVLLEELKDRINLFATRNTSGSAAEASAGTSEMGGASANFNFTDATKRVKMAESNYTHTRVMELQRLYPSTREFLAYLFRRKRVNPIRKRRYRVVADFAIPFRCCSSCLQVDELPSPDITMQLDPSEFCYTDTKRYPVRIDPEGGELTSSGGGIITEGGHYYFVPSQTTSTDETITLTYTLDGQSVQVTVLVYHPVADFEFVHGIDIAGRPNVYLKNKSQHADTFKWTNAITGEEYTDKDLRFYYSQIDTDLLTMTLRAYKGRCVSEPVTKETNIPHEPPQEIIFTLEPPKYNFPNLIYCNNDAQPYPFTIIPAGDEVMGQGVVKMDNGNFYFIPQGLNESEYIFKYMGEEIHAQVLKAQEIKFEYDPGNYNAREKTLSVVFVFKGNIDNQLIWNFGDGTQTQQTLQPVITKVFNLGNQTKFDVSVDMRNTNGCLSSYHEVLDFSQYVNGSTPGIIVIPDWGMVRLDTLYSDPLRSRLAEYNYSADESILHYYNNIEKEIASDATKKEAFLSGSMNAAIAKEYSKALENTKATIVKAKEKGDEETTRYLMEIYLGILQQMVATIGTLSKEPAKSSALFKSLSVSASQLEELKDLSVDINPGGSLKGMVKKSVTRLSTKKNISEIIASIGKLM